MSETKNRPDLINQQQPSQEEHQRKSVVQSANERKVEKLKAGLFFTFVTAIGVISGFGYSLGSTKKRETKNLSGDKLNQYYHLHDAGVDLARRALARATLYSVTGFSLVCLAVWKISGASDFKDFRNKVGRMLPKISKPPEQQQGRSEFENLTDLIQYIIDKDKEKHHQKDDGSQK